MTYISIVISVIVGFLLYQTQLNVAGASDLWKQVLQEYSGPR